MSSKNIVSTQLNWSECYSAVTKDIKLIFLFADNDFNCHEYCKHLISALFKNKIRS